MRPVLTNRLSRQLLDQEHRLVLAGYCRVTAAGLRLAAHRMTFCLSGPKAPDPPHACITQRANTAFDHSGQLAVEEQILHLIILAIWPSLCLASSLGHHLSGKSVEYTLVQFGSRSVI